jgi:hypothetical protein
MLRSLHLTDVGPSRRLDFEFAPRLNILTGDNGLGKSFVLDVIWWAMTNTWSAEKAFPLFPHSHLAPTKHLKPEISASLSLTFDAAPHPEEVSTGGVYKWETQEWMRKRWSRRRDGDTYSHPPDQPPSPYSMLVIYARLDGSYAVWDGLQIRPEHDELAEVMVLFDRDEIWEGKETHEGKRRRTVSRGLLEDWVTWQYSQAREYDLLREVLAILSEPDEPLVPVAPMRVRLDDRRDIPTLRTPYGLVPITLASAGQRRVLSLAYMLVWTWTEHLKAASLSKRAPTRDMVILIDEVELHLHPRWQRLFLPALLAAIRALAPDVSVQLIATTHAPLVLASLEPLFDEDHDNLYRFEREGPNVVAHNLTFAKQGDAANWLVSETFGLELPRSVPSAAAIQAASDYMRGDTASAETALRNAVAHLDSLPLDPSLPLKDRIHTVLLRLLPDHDDFWPRWIVSYEPRLSGEDTR